MKIINRKFVFLLFLLFICTNTLLFSQDTCQLNFYKDENLKKGNWAVVFELGSMLWGSNYNYNSKITQKTENYYFLLKYQTGEKTAIRLGVNFEGNSSEYYDDDPNYHHSSNYNEFFIGAGVNLQYYITKKYFAKPFISVGPFYDINLFKDYSSKYYNWNLGLDITFGAEMFVYKSVGIIAEYVMRTSLEKNHSEYVSSVNNMIENTNYRWRNTANTSRLGVTFYF
jgi:hypothetical protein